MVHIKKKKSYTLKSTDQKKKKKVQHCLESLNTLKTN